MCQSLIICQGSKVARPNDTGERPTRLALCKPKNPRRARTEQVVLALTGASGPNATSSTIWPDLPEKSQMAV